VSPSPAPAPSVPAAAAEPTAITAAVEAIGPSVVNIDTTALTQEFFGPFVREVPSQGQGSGVIFSEDGLVLTNNHVIEGAQVISVTLTDKRQFEARVVGRDPLSDLAVLKISADQALPAARMGDSDAVRIGEWVVAVGNPLGFSNSVTVGVLSARERSLTSELRDLLQTDAAINPGNSGGALVNVRGEVIGITTAIIRGAQGIGFAIPSNTAVRIASELREKGRVVRPYLGVSMTDLDARIRRYLELPEEVQGVVITGLARGGPAARAGLAPGDLVTAVDGRPVESARDLQERVRDARVGDTLVLSIYRQGKELRLPVTLGEMPSRTGSP
jgi:serine protease Do